jgi:hypothetical protein
MYIIHGKEFFGLLGNFASRDLGTQQLGYTKAIKI